MCPSVRIVVLVYNFYSKIIIHIHNLNKFMAKKYTNPWTFNGEIYDGQDIDQYAGFVYRITDLTSGKKYIGRKYFFGMKKQPTGRRKTVESNWRDYYSSSDVIKKSIKEHGKDNFKREILVFAKTPGDVNMLEVKYQFCLNVLEDDTYINDNINGKWFRKAEHILEGRKFSNVI